ncbi:PA0069 family radical SAM protein [Rhodospirillaceae bacterium SYSU D60014]|uniref:PA0069 family radical SAM protein n=1 Tax=Virgifigura deserti TaxID=2268457 RepID=UPI000E66DE09
MGVTDTEPPDSIPDDRLPDQPLKGRGAVSNRSGRFEAAAREASDDGWRIDESDDDLPPLRTTVMPDASRTVIARNRSPDIPFDRSINPYRGCEHGCVYCFARPTHAFLGFSPGLDFETRLVAKFDAPELLAKELSAKSYRCDVMALGTNTDPYQPIEREHRITRRVLEVLAAFNHPVAIVTKSTLVTRDIDILAPMAAKGLAQVCISVTTLDRELARRMEPRAATPGRRLATIGTLAAAGIPTGVMAAPMIPALNDSELEAILQTAETAGATSAAYVLLRLPLEIKDLFAEWLEAHAPGKAKHVMSLVRQMRGGRLNDPDFGSRFAGDGPYAALLRQRFRLACRRLGLNKRSYRLDCSQFRPPPPAGEQFRLL